MPLVYYFPCIATKVLPPRDPFKTAPHASPGSADFYAEQYERPVLKSNMPPKRSFKGLREPILELRKLPESRFRSSESSPKRSRTAPGCTPAHPCAPGIPHTRLKSLRSEPGHGFQSLLGHLISSPSLPAQCPCSTVFHVYSHQSFVSKASVLDRPPCLARVG